MPCISIGPQLYLHAALVPLGEQTTVPVANAVPPPSTSSLIVSGSGKVRGAEGGRGRCSLSILVSEGRDLVNRRLSKEDRGVEGTKYCLADNPIE